jgi:AcrR family transcriptional regulator
MAEPACDATSRLDRRKARTRAALIHAAQRLLAAGTVNVPIVEITEGADVGMGSFYNHFATKEELFRAAVDDALDVLGARLDELSAGLADPAHAFAQSFRLFGRLHRRNPELSKVLLGQGVALLTRSDHGLTPWTRRGLEAAVAAGRFRVRDVELALGIVAATALALGQLLHDQPGRDDAETTDQVTEDLLRLLGVPAREAVGICRRPLPHLGPTGGSPVFPVSTL